MNYLDHLKELEALPWCDKQKRIDSLIATAPGKVWPPGMPASIDPKLVLIGETAGNSPDRRIEMDPNNPGGGYLMTSVPTVIKPDNSHFYYTDTSNYWNKMRYFAYAYFTSYGLQTENQAISLTTHFNLEPDTTKESGFDYTEWISTLLNNSHSPDLVVFFGLRTKIDNNYKEIRDRWNHQDGLRVDWQHGIEVPFKTKGGQYAFRQWWTTNENGHPVCLVAWPQHPSRPPFTDANFYTWKRAIREYLSVPPCCRTAPQAVLNVLGDE